MFRLQLNDPLTDVTVVAEEKRKGVGVEPTLHVEVSYLPSVPHSVATVWLLFLTLEVANELVDILPL